MNYPQYEAAVNREKNIEATRLAELVRAEQYIEVAHTGEVCTMEPATENDPVFLSGA